MTVEPQTKSKTKLGPLAGLSRSVKELAEKFDLFATTLSSFEDRLLKVESLQIKDTQTSYEPPTQDDVTAEVPSNSKVVEAAKKILGDGDPARCQFAVSVEAHSADSFRLVLIPPAHLKENATDRRIKVIPHLQGVPGAAEYALRVKNFCVLFANKKGINYFVKT